MQMLHFSQMREGGVPVEIQEKQNALLKGILGALLGGLVGGIAIVLLGQAGLASAFAGVILSVGTLKGYERFSGKMDKRGLMVCFPIMLAVPYLVDRATWTMVIVKELGFAVGDAFLYVHNVVEHYGLQADYWKTLLFIYAFTVVGSIGTVKQVIKQVREED